MSAERWEGPIFVVGPSRGGTALMRSCLNQHGDVHLAGETHYFDDLRVKLAGRERSRLTAEERRRCEDYFLALAHRPYGHGGDPAASPLDRVALRAAADRLGDGADAYFEAFCRLVADTHGKSLWGDKTPRHVFRIPEILRRYPQAKILCMVRDPRAVVASYRNWRKQGGFDLEADPGHAQAIQRDQERAARSYNLVVASLLWRSAANASISAVRQYGSERVFVQRYEDLVKDPDTTLRRLAVWLGVDFHAAMLDVPLHNSSFEAFNASAGVSTAPVDRWRQILDPREIDTVQRCAGRALVINGYARESPSTSAAHRVRVWASVPLAVVRAAAANRDRVGNLPEYLWRRLRMLQTSR